MDREHRFSARRTSQRPFPEPGLKGVDLVVYPGEIVGLVGENGAGKSTLLKIIIGAQPPTSGRMEMHGKPYQPHTPWTATARGWAWCFRSRA
jgi:ribose transport system ATP-binding protein